MPKLTKQAISQFIRTECLRQLRLNLSRTEQDAGQRQLEELPPKQQPRPGLQLIREQGHAWQAEKVGDLIDAFGWGRVLGNVKRNDEGEVEYHRVNLGDYTQEIYPGSFLTEAKFEVTKSFAELIGVEEYEAEFHLSYGPLVPDIIEILSPLKFTECISADGRVHHLPEDDHRVQLRVIDMKLMAEPSAGHYAEITYYSMALASWLVDHDLQKQYVVVPNAALWPGSHEASNLKQTCQELKARGTNPTYEELWEAMQEDLEHVPFEVFAAGIKQFLRDDLKQALSARRWEDLRWGVNHRCRGCDYLGYPWYSHGKPTFHPKHCLQQAQREGHISQIAFIGRGESRALENHGITDVKSLAAVGPDHNVFDAHHNLRAGRHIVAARAESLGKRSPCLPAHGGSSIIMPRWADLHVYLTVNFDVGSALTFAMGIKAFWREPHPYGYSGSYETKAWDSIFVVNKRDVSVERQQLLHFLDTINDILRYAHKRNQKTSVQFYVWDPVQFKHLTRIIGRHLPAILSERSISHLAWLFPPEDVLPNPDMEARKSPITVVKEVVRSFVAVPVAHCYTLFTVAREYHDSKLPQQMAEFHVHPLYEDLLSDQIPSERAHGLWTNSKILPTSEATLRETVNKQLLALQTVTRRLEKDLGKRLRQKAPIIQIKSPQQKEGISLDGQLWYGFAKLDAVLNELEVLQARSMPPHEREARLNSARLTKLVRGERKEQFLAQLDQPSNLKRRVYEMRPESREVKFREGDFTCAIAPEADAEFLDKSLYTVTKGTPLERSYNSGGGVKMEKVASVQIVAIDRDNNMIVLDPNRRYEDWLELLEDNKIVSFAQDVTLDRTWSDFFTRKVLNVLKEIGNPPNAQDTPLAQRVRQATGAFRATKQEEISERNPAGDILWAAESLAQSSGRRELAGIKAQLEENGITLNASQWDAWHVALSTRLQLIWGPPGTGKSRTLQAVALGAVADALKRKQHMRILICGPTYTAVSNVLVKSYDYIAEKFPDADIQVRRIRSPHRARTEDIPVPSEIDLKLNKADPFLASVLRDRLENKIGITLVGATSQQIYNLMTLNDEAAMSQLFDLIILDEASQMDVGQAILPFASLAENGVLIVAGDPTQLPPIHKAKPPKELEDAVGSIFNYFKKVRQIEPAELNTNYRSNQTIVEFAHEAGYRQTLSSYSHKLRINLIKELPLGKKAPQDWPDALYWTPRWSELLDPNQPATCFVYKEGVSGQWNRFEADAIASLVFLLFTRMGSQLKNERDTRTGEIIPTDSKPYDKKAFWEQGIGIVTPHRAQQALIVSRLQHVFAPYGIDGSLIRGAVDTVERFQGQQRDIIIASYALGDEDAIRDEEEFLMSLNRFNVMVSRARAKIIVLVSQEVIKHLSDDIDVLRESKLLKVYADSFCNVAESIKLGHVVDNEPRLVEGLLKYHQ
jgi:hypothetical protein